MRNILTIFVLILFINQTAFANYPDFANTYMGQDKFENYNRKMFAFNLGLNKYAIKPIHTVWASIMPKYGIERIQSVYKNIEYPKRVISCLIQKDFKASGTETVRFLTNTTLGLGGMFDPAKKFFKIEPVDEDIEQALSKCNMKSGPFLVLPVLAATSPRNITGRLLDTALNPTTYVATPILALVKAGLTVNRTSYVQPLVEMIESTYADPYEIARKLYGIERHIKCANLDRNEVLNNTIKEVNSEDCEIALLDNEENEVLTAAEVLYGGVDNAVLKSYESDTIPLMADIVLFDYNPQSPVIDSMRTALFDLPEIKKSMWAEFSLWNRSFCNRIKTSSVNIAPEKENYKFKYIMQHDKNSPLAIIYPSIGEGITSYHSAVLAKIFYDAGYSVIIQGSHFQWEFVKSMPDGYIPGIPERDAKQLIDVTGKIISKLEEKYECEFKNKVLLGTSFGALTTLFIANLESQNPILNIGKYISICPPVELVYAMEQVDKNMTEDSKDLKERVALTAAKVAKLMNETDKTNIKTLPFSHDEAKIITSFIMHQKLSDLVYTIENTSRCKNCTDIYKNINQMNYRAYVDKYLLNDEFKLEDLKYTSSLHSISDYLKNNNNYKIYHSLNDYLTNQSQLKKLKQYSGSKTVLLDNGAHLGFLYRKEFLDDLKNTITP